MGVWKIVYKVGITIFAHFLVFFHSFDDDETGTLQVNELQEMKERITDVISLSGKERHVAEDVAQQWIDILDPDKVISKSRAH